MMVIANLYLLAWDWDRWQRVLCAREGDAARHGDILTAAGLLTAAAVGFLGITLAHLARLREQSFLIPAGLVLAATALGVAMLRRAYRRQR